MNIVITGGSSGLGAALTRSLAQDGHSLFICARSEDRLAEVAAGLDNVGYHRCDVSSEADVIDFFAAAKDYLGSVDVLLHCAGIMGAVGSCLEVDSQYWLQTLQSNVYGAFLVSRHVVGLMHSERRPRILLMSGGGAFDPMPCLSAYGVSKAGIVRLGETLAVELADRNIAVNILAPGFIASPIFDDLLKLGREHGKELYDTVLQCFDKWHPSDIERPINCVRFLISEASASLTGKTISARFDPWDQPEFVECIRDILASKLYQAERVNLDRMPESEFVITLKAAQARKFQRI